MRQINLLPEDLQNVEKKKTIRNYAVLTLGPAIVFIVLLHLFLVFRVESLTIVADRPPAQIDSPEINKLRQQLNSLEAEMVSFVNKNKVIVDTLTQYVTTTNILRIISRATLDKVWLTAFVLNSENATCQIEGRSFNTRLVSEFMLELKSLPYFEDVELITMGKGVQVDRDEVDFKIICKLK